MTMFSSNPFPELPSSPNVIFPPNFMFDRERDTDCFNYHMNNRDPFIANDCFQASYNSFAPPSSATIGNTTTIKQDFCNKEHMFIEEQELRNSKDHDDDDLLDSIISSCKKKTTPVVSKKDGHSKIYTARGPRDRRVRLSIDISRKFFCLQDLLGFDKASKTLDWLFGKCKTAIKELVEETNCCPSSTTGYQSKTSFLEAIMGGRDVGKSKKRLGLKFVDGNRKKITQKLPVGVQENLARDQSRAVARARARERVREKMHIKELDDELKTLVHDDFHYQKFKSGVRENQRVISAYPTAGEYQ